MIQSFCILAHFGHFFDLFTYTADKKNLKFSKQTKISSREYKFTLKYQNLWLLDILLRPWLIAYVGILDTWNKFFTNCSTLLFSTKYVQTQLFRFLSTWSNLANLNAHIFNSNLYVLMVFICMVFITMIACFLIHVLYSPPYIWNIIIVS